MPMEDARGAVLGLVLVVIISITMYLTHWAVSLSSETVECSAPTAMEQKPDNGTSRRLLSPTEYGIDI
jgi:uncharacterized membrane protein